MTSTYLSLAVCLVGVLLWFLAKDGKVADLGGIMTIVGLVFTLWFGVRHP